LDLVFSFLINMGATCAPSSKAENVEANIDLDDEQATERFTKIINDYQADNEKLREQLEEVKNQNDTIVTEHKDKAKQNEEVMRELEAMKAAMETKNRALVRGRLEAALLSKATSLLADNSATRQFMKGQLKHHFRVGITKAKTKKDKWVELHMIEGEIEENGYKAGYVLLTYADSKDAETSKRCQILEVTMDESQKGLIFSVLVNAEGVKKELVFACETEEERKEWVTCINDALADVKGIFDKMHEEFTLKLEFSKEKMGIRVEESLVDNAEIDEKVQKRRNDSNDEKSASKEQEKKDVEKANASENQAVEHKNEELPCQLIVNNIKDQDLVAGGLVLNCAVKAINDIPLVGMVYSDQLKLLTTTPKPFTLTFTGKNFLRDQAKQKHGYNSILKELVADGENSVKNAFYELVKGTPFERELQSSEDQVTTIRDLLTNQRRLMALLHNLQVQEVEL